MTYTYQFYGYQLSKLTVFSISTNFTCMAWSSTVCRTWRSIWSRLGFRLLGPAGGATGGGGFSCSVLTGTSLNVDGAVGGCCPTERFSTCEENVDKCICFKRFYNEYSYFIKYFIHAIMNQFITKLPKCICNIPIYILVIP